MEKGERTDSIDIIISYVVFPVKVACSGGLLTLLTQCIPPCGIKSVYTGNPFMLCSFSPPPPRYLLPPSLLHATNGISEPSATYIIQESVNMLADSHARIQVNKGSFPFPSANQALHWALCSGDTTTLLLASKYNGSATLLAAVKTKQQNGISLGE